MAGKSKIDEDCEELSVVADPWILKLKPAVNRVGPCHLRKRLEKPVNVVYCKLMEGKGVNTK